MTPKTLTRADVRQALIELAAQGNFTRHSTYIRTDRDATTDEHLAYGTGYLAVLRDLRAALGFDEEEIRRMDRETTQLILARLK